MQKEKAKEQVSSCRVFLAPLFRTQFFFFNFDRPNDATSSKDRLSFLRLVNNQQGKMDPASRPPPPPFLSLPQSHYHRFSPRLHIMRTNSNLFFLLYRYLFPYFYWYLFLVLFAFAFLFPFRIVFLFAMCSPSNIDIFVFLQNFLSDFFYKFHLTTPHTQHPHTHSHSDTLKKITTK